MFVKQSCSNSSLGGDCINLLLLGECLFKIQITAYHHPPRFLLVPLKLSVKLGDKLHLRNLLWFSKYLLLFCSLPEVGKKGCGKLCARGAPGRAGGREAALASAVLGICWQNVLFISGSDRDASDALVCLCPILQRETRLVTNFEVILNPCCLWWCNYGQC